MPDWEAELKDLLAQLDVLYDLGEPDFSADLPTDETDEETVDEANDTRAAQFDTSMLALEARAARADTRATLARLESLTRSGQLDPEVRDDIVIALRTLMRPLPRRASQSMMNEWQIESTTAVLRLSRAIMRLTFRMAPPIER
jgi:hypothetical protein